MRTLFLWLLLAVVAGGSVYGAERTWTIARDVYTANGELITVRGDLAYLKIDGRVQEIPIERLSALDQQYIASLTLGRFCPVRRRWSVRKLAKSCRKRCRCQVNRMCQRNHSNSTDPTWGPCTAVSRNRCRAPKLASTRVAA